MLNFAIAKLSEVDFVKTRSVRAPTRRLAPCGIDGALSKFLILRIAPMSKRSKSTSKAKCDWQALTAEGQQNGVKVFFVKKLEPSDACPDEMKGMITNGN